MVTVRYIPSPDVISRRLADETVLVNRKTDLIFTLNATGSRFWELLQEHADIAQIRDILLAEYEISGYELDAEIQAIITYLSNEGLIIAQQF
jgi:hypothetical protein